MKLKLNPSLALLLLITGCGGMPHHAETRVERVAQLVFASGPEGAVVTVDGAEAGRLHGDKFVIAIPGGTHSVAVQAQGQTIYQRSVFIEEGTQKIISLAK